MTAPPARAHRAALDHVLALIAGSETAETLVLRGSMTLPAWLGERAREPGDLDWIVLPPHAVPIDPHDPYPYVDGPEAFQHWPEAVGGATAYELFRDENEAFETGGLHPRMPPEGTHWLPDPDTDQPGDPWVDVVPLVRENPVASHGVRFDTQGARFDSTWGYYAYGSDEQSPGVRLFLPWEADGTRGEIQLDFARDERLPEAPVFTLVPRIDGQEPTLVRTVSPELSLAWKLLWLHTDSGRDDRARGKDLHDAVLLAESPRVHLQRRLLERVFARAAVTFDPGDIPGWNVDWHAFRNRHPRTRGSADDWLDRLVRAVGRITDAAKDTGEPRSPHG
ncbi:MAG TPA: nucleotidyl transferase AbiEii/AbiGii toxin family protein [Yinghuangia sp.]|uniref:nucleotidyl transferase AbiEii/AbiGii toxin family protein n=1 Tax=Yinghuangia sp. YIM S10712 TaxID=3436930 RepID=UPI002CAA5EED|nr:nucleotidyl transferase AbiEii/AbiGii toxin family protein [Yinghuangia sp.]